MVVRRTEQPLRIDTSQCSCLMSLTRFILWSYFIKRAKHLKAKGLVKRSLNIWDPRTTSHRNFLIERYFILRRNLWYSSATAVSLHHGWKEFRHPANRAGDAAKVTVSVWCCLETPLQETSSPAETTWRPSRAAITFSFLRKHVHCCSTRSKHTEIRRRSLPEEWAHALLLLRHYCKMKFRINQENVAERRHPYAKYRWPSKWSFSSWV
jgi:hypothetical protein